jgi:hypothetical protein
LASKGYSYGTKEDRWNSFLTAKGFSGSVDDMLAQWQRTKEADLYLDFVARDYLDQRITFTRADTAPAATRFNSSGLMEVMGVNLALWSGDFTQAAWAKNATGDGTVPTVTANYAAGPFGAMDATRIQLTRAGGTGLSRVIQTITATGTAMTQAWWVKTTDGSTKTVGLRDALAGQVEATVDGTWRVVRLQVSAGSNEMSILTWNGMAGTSATCDLLVYRAGLFSGTYTAEQIQSQGIALTTTAATSGPRFMYDPAVPAGVTGESFVDGTSSYLVGGTLTATSYSYSGALVVGGGTFFTSTRLPTAGKTYLVSYTINSTNGFVSLGFGAVTPGTSRGAPGTYSEYLVAPSAIGVTLVSRGAGGNQTDISNISVKEVTFTPQGLWIEEARTNLLLHSRDMTQAAWTKTNTGAVRNQVGLDGVANTACTLTDTTTSTALVQNGGAITAGAIITGSVVLKYSNNAWMRMIVGNSGLTSYAQSYFNIQTGVKGTLSITGTASSQSATITALGGGWYRCTVTCIADASSTVPAIALTTAAADASGPSVVSGAYIVDCAQLEAASTASTIIVTGAASATRAADNASMTGTNFSSWFSGTAGTIVTDTVGGSSSGRLFTVSDGTINAQIFSAINGTFGAQQIYTSGAWATQQGPLTTGSNKVAGAYAANDFAVSTNGGAALTDTAGALAASYNKLDIGKSWDGVVPFNGGIKRITFYNTRLPNATLQALTT